MNDCDQYLFERLLDDAEKQYDFPQGVLKRWMSLGFYLLEFIAPDEAERIEWAGSALPVLPLLKAREELDNPRLARIYEEIKAFDNEVVEQKKHGGQATDAAISAAMEHLSLRRTEFDANMIAHFRAMLEAHKQEVIALYE